MYHTFSGQPHGPAWPRADSPDDSDGCSQEDPYVRSFASGFAQWVRHLPAGRGAHVREPGTSSGAQMLRWRVSGIRNRQSTNASAGTAMG